LTTSTLSRCTDYTEEILHCYGTVYFAWTAPRYKRWNFFKSLIAENCLFSAAILWQ